MNKQSFARPDLISVAAILSLLGIFLANPPGACAQAARIFMDGHFDDWEALTPLYSDSLGDQVGGDLDFGQLWVANDENYFFLCIEVGAEIILQENNNVTLYLDTDNDSSTGTPINGIGAELDWNFADRRGHFVIWSISYTIEHGDIGLISAPTYSSEVFEIALEREATPIGSYALFPSDTVKIVFADEGPGQDLLPDQGTVISCVFDDSPLPPLQPLTLQKQDSAHVRVLSYNVHLDNFFEPYCQDAYDRILSALQPEIIGFQEIYDHSVWETLDQVEGMLPSGPGQQWYGEKVNPDVVAVSRYPILQTFNVHEDGNGAFLIDLQPDYDCDLLLIVAHLPAGQENTARQYEVDAIMGFIRDAKAPGGVLDLEENTPILIIGDMNFVGYAQQLQTMLTGQIIYQGQFGPPFDPDWDGSDFADLLPRHTDLPLFFTWYNLWSFYSPGQLDFMVYSDAVMEAGSNFVLFTPEMSPDSLAAYGLLADDATTASDHLPLVGDFAPLTGPGVEPEVSQTLPQEYKLGKNYPNPFNAVTTIRFTLQTANWVTLEVFDISGRRVGARHASPLLDRCMDAGYHEVTFDGSSLASGVYLYRIEAGTWTTAGKMVLMK